MEFEAPLVAGPKLPARQQRVVLEEDVIPLSPSVGYSLRPGDKVLALWQPGQQQYGPGTVLLGLEMRDPRRASKEEEITVHFWNGRAAKVPLGGVQSVSLAIWKKAVERLHKSFTREHPRPLHWPHAALCWGQSLGASLTSFLRALHSCALSATLMPAASCCARAASVAAPHVAPLGGL